MEDFLKNKADQHSIEPKSSTWDAIEKQLLRKKRRKLLWIFSYAATGILVLGLIWVGLSGQFDNSNPPSDELTQQNSQNPNNSEQTINSLEQTPETVQNDVNQTENKIEEKVDQSGLEQQLAKATPRVAKQQPEVVPVPAQHDPNEDVYPVHPKPDESGGWAKRKEPPRQGPVRKEKRERKKAVTPADSVEEEKPKQAIAVISKEAIDSARLNPPPAVTILPLRYGDQLWALLFDYQYGQAFYRAKELNVNENYGSFASTPQSVDARKESPGTSWGFGVLAERKIRPQLSLGFGLQYQKMQWIGYVGNDAQYTLDQNGDKTIGDSVNTNAGITEVKVRLNAQDRGFQTGQTSFKSSLELISVPVYLSYRKQFNEKWFASVQLGVQLNKVSSVQILQYHPLLYTYITRDEQAEEINQWSGSVMSSLNIERRLNTNWGVQLGMQSQQFITSLHTFNDTDPVQRRPYQYGFRAAIIHRFRFR